MTTKIFEIDGLPNFLRYRAPLASYLRHAGAQNIISLYYIDTNDVLLKNTPLVKFIRNYIQDSSGIFSISSLVRISMILLMSSLSLKCTSICWCMIETSLGLPQKSSAMFSNFSEILLYLRKFSKNVRQHSYDLWISFGESSEIFGKWLEIFGKLSKMPSSVCLYNKKNTTH